jgi:hypothetical protein
MSYFAATYSSADCVKKDCKPSIQLFFRSKLQEHILKKVNAEIQTAKSFG